MCFPAGTNANGPLAYVCDVNSGDVPSEGMSYGMMIAVQLGKKAEFDTLWNAPGPSGRYRYYDGLLYLQALLHCSGEFRIWAPQ